MGIAPWFARIPRPRSTECGRGPCPSGSLLGLVRVGGLRLACAFSWLDGGERSQMPRAKTPECANQKTRRRHLGVYAAETKIAILDPTRPTYRPGRWSSHVGGFTCRPPASSSRSPANSCRSAFATAASAMVQAGSPRIVRSAVGSASWARRARQSSKVSGHVTSAIASTHQPSEAAYRRPRRLRGTFLPFLRASDSPIAIACLRLLTLPPLPPFPLLKVPRFRRRIAPSTSLLAPRLYFGLPDVFRAIVCPPYESVDEVSFLDQLAHLVGQHGQRDLLAVGLATDQRLRKMRQLLERDLGGHRRLEGIHDPLHNDRPGCGEGGGEGGATLGWILDGDAIAAAGLREKGEVDRVQVAAIFGIAQEDHLLPLYLAQR